MYKSTSTAPQTIDYISNTVVTAPSISLHQNENTFGVAQTEISNNRNSFLDYTFLVHRQMIYEKKTKDPKKIREYNFDLEKTLELNIDLMNKIPLNLKKKEEINSIESIYSEILKKNKERIKKQNEVKELTNKILLKKQALINLTKNNEEEEIRMNKQYEDKMLKISQKEKYMHILNKKFKEIEKFIENNYINEFQNKYNEITQFLNENKSLSKEEKILTSDIKKLKEQIMEIKKENKMFLEESKLYKSNENPELIRVIDFYRGLIRSVQTKIKILQSSFDNMTKTLNFLNLGDSKIIFY